MGRNKVKPEQASKVLMRMPTEAGQPELGNAFILVAGARS